MRRRAKLWITLVVVTLSATMVLWNTGAATSETALTVREAKFRALDAPGDAVTVRGVVAEGTILESGGRLQEFVVEDLAERLRVVYDGAPPDNFGVKEVVLKGTVHVDDEGTPFLRATDIQVGCASKY